MEQERLDGGAAALLVGLNLGRTGEHFALLMEELESLAEACGMSVIGSIVQNADHVVKATLVGSGKVQEIKRSLAERSAQVVIFNETLSPMQLRNLGNELGVEIMDRTGLILEIFSKRARTREARLACECASLEYMLPRLAGLRTSLGRQGGTSGSMSNRGAGEKKIELDRRHIEHRLAELRRELDGIERERATQRSRRLSSGMYKVALVGYTNSGKSTLMNRLLELCPEENSEKRVYVEDMLFATLDTVVRKISVEGHRPFLLSDTVGFISELPHTLVKAFRSTIDEVKYADLLLEVVDYSNPEYKDNLEVTARTLAEIGAGAIPRITVFNKVERAELVAANPQMAESMAANPQGYAVAQPTVRIPTVRNGNIYLSAGQAVGLEELLDLIEVERSKSEVPVELLIPYKDMAALDYLKRNAVVLSTDYQEDGVRLTARCRQADARRFRALA